jgi:polysaccharide biosynthesis/export protein
LNIKDHCKTVVHPLLRLKFSPFLLSPILAPYFFRNSMTKGIIWFVALAVIVSSCVPNRKYVLLQKNDVNRKDLPKDSILRTYNLQLSNYKIQPQDILSVMVETLTPDEYNFFKELNPTVGGLGGGGAMGGGLMLRGYLVDNDGNVPFPVIGQVELAGLSIFEAEEKMKDILKDYLRDPVVRIRLLNFRFTFVGEINTQITSFIPRISMVEAIALAGGLPELADRENIKVIRQRGNQADVFYVNLLDEAFVRSEFFYLQQNDIIFISALKQRPVRMYWTQNIGLFVSTVSVVLLIVNLLTR